MKNVLYGELIRNLVHASEVSLECGINDPTSLTDNYSKEMEQYHFFFVVVPVRKMLGILCRNAGCVFDHPDSTWRDICDD